MSIEKAFGSALKNMRLERGFSQEKLADISGFHRTYISLLERGIKSPSLSTVERLGKALNVSLEQFAAKIENFRNKNTK